MINTIFYFPESLTFDQYIDLLDSNTDEGIARRTIVFAKQQGKIYNNGKLYGTTASDVQSLIDETKEYLEGLIDDTKVDFNSLIERINTSLDEVRNDLDNVLSRESDGINQMIEDVIDSKGFIDGWQAGWDNNIKAYLIQAGIIDANDDKGWAYLETKYDELKAQVNSIEVGDGLTVEIVHSLIDARIEENSSIAELKNRYALTNEDKTVLKWLSAGLYSEANANSSLTSVFASAESVADNTSAISALTTRVSNLESEDFLTESSLVSEIRKKKGDISTVLSEAGLVNTAKLNEATSTLSSRLDGVETTSGNNVDAISALQLSVQNLEDNGAPATESSVISAINVHKDDIVETLSSAGLVNTATLESATSTLQTNIDNVNSRIVTESKIEEIAGEAVETATAGMVVESDLDDYVKKASIIASINSSGESNVSISADKINLDGDVIARRLTAASAAIGGFTIGQDELSGTYDYTTQSGEYLTHHTSQVTLSPQGFSTTEITGIASNTTNQILSDGSGFIASGVLNWDAHGNVNLGNGENGTVTILSNGLTTKGWIRVIGGIYIENAASQQPGRISYMDADDAIAVKNLHIGGIEQGASGTITFGDTAGTVYISEPEDDYLELSAANGVRILGELSVGSASVGYLNTYANIVQASSFVKRGSSDDYVLLAGGGTKALSEFSSSVDWSNVQNKPTNVSAFTNDAGYLTSHSVSAGDMDIYSADQQDDLKTVFDAKSGQEVQFMGGASYNFDNRVQAGSFVKLYATSDEVLMADGSTMTLAELKAALEAI